MVTLWTVRFLGFRNSVVSCEVCWVSVYFRVCVLWVVAARCWIWCRFVIVLWEYVLILGLMKLFGLGIY